jgi:hypothetical protein
VARCADGDEEGDGWGRKPGSVSVVEVEFELEREGPDAVSLPLLSLLLRQSAGRSGALGFVTLCGWRRTWSAGYVLRTSYFERAQERVWMGM